MVITNMSKVIKFDDKNYQWETINGKRCLVPIKGKDDDFTKSKELDEFRCEDNFNWVLLRFQVDKKNQFMLFGKDKFIAYYGYNNAHGITASTIPALFTRLKAAYPNWYKTLKKTN